MPVRTALAWFAVSRPSAAGISQVSSISLGLRLVSTAGSAPAPTKTAPAQYAGWDVVRWISVGWVAAGSAVQKAEAGWTGRMIPVISSWTGPMDRREPGRRPYLAAVAAVTTPSSCPVRLDGRRPATRWL